MIGDKIDFNTFFLLLGGYYMNHVIVLFYIWTNLRSFPLRRVSRSRTWMVSRDLISHYCERGMTTAEPGKSAAWSSWPDSDSLSNQKEDIKDIKASLLHLCCASLSVLLVVQCWKSLLSLWKWCINVSWSRFIRCWAPPISFCRTFWYTTNHKWYNT